MLTGTKQVFRILATLAAIAVLTVIGVGVAGSSPEPQAASSEAQAAIGAAICANPGIYVGTDATGQFQDALENAISQAEACAGCCDIRVSYEVLKTTGQRGGFVFLNDIFVEIKASW